MAQVKIIYGVHSVMGVLEHRPENVLALYCQDNSKGQRLKPLLEKAQALDLVVQMISLSKLDKLTQSEHHQGVAAKVRSSPELGNANFFQWLDHTQKKPLLLILEGIQDPHNLGACLRSANALGVDWVILPKLHSAPLNATVSKAACGADQSLPILLVGNIAHFIEQIRDYGVWIVGTQAQASTSLSRIDLTRGTAFVMGAEGKGVKRLTLSLCDETVGIPLGGAVASLNVSVATGICLYECQRQRQNSEFCLR